MLFDRFKQVEAFVFSVEGVLSDGRIWVDTLGEQLQSFHSKDAYAIQRAVQSGYPVAFFSTHRPYGLKHGMERLGVKDVILDIEDKQTIFEDWLLTHGLVSEIVLYMGGDIPDLPSMKIAGLPVCPADAAEEIKAASAYISFGPGGAGAVRDVIEKVMKLQDAWH